MRRPSAQPGAPEPRRGRTAATEPGRPEGRGAGGLYRARPEAARRDAARPRPSGPRIDADITGEELDKPVRAQLAGLSPHGAERASRHLVMAARLLEDDPAAAYQHAQAARAVHGASRVAAVREAVGLSAYAAGRYAEALPELRAARRISGSPELLPVIADAERGVGHPDRALRVAAEPDVARLDAGGRAEMLIVAAGAHRDTGRLDAALATLRVPALDSRTHAPWLARLRYAYADAVLASGDTDEAARWFAAAAEADADVETDAAERLAELQGFSLTVEDVDALAEGAGPDEPPQH